VILFICAAAGLVNGSIFKIIPLVLPEQAASARSADSFRRLLLGRTMDLLGSPAWAYTAMAVFTLGCLGLNGWFINAAPHPPHF
jgi:hypothetical protein